MESRKSVGDKSFSGYKNVSVSYHDLKRKIDNPGEWRTVLKSRKGVYLISDKNYREIVCRLSLWQGWDFWSLGSLSD